MLDGRQLIHTEREQSLKYEVTEPFTQVGGVEVPLDAARTSLYHEAALANPAVDGVEYVAERVGRTPCG